MAAVQERFDAVADQNFDVAAGFVLAVSIAALVVASRAVHYYYAVLVPACLLVSNPVC